MHQTLKDYASTKDLTAETGFVFYSVYAYCCAINDCKNNQPILL